MKMRASCVMLSSMAVAVRMPLAVQRPPMTRCASPVMGSRLRDPDATRDQAPTVLDPSGPPIGGPVRAVDYLQQRRQTTGAVVSTRPQQAARPSAREAAPTPVPAPRAAPPTILVQGGSLRTWAYRNPALEAVQVVLSSEGRPIHANIQLWQGPGNVPCNMTVFVENGQLRPFSAVLATPRHTMPIFRPSFGDNVNAKPGAVPSTVAIRNVGHLEFPFAATCVVDDVDCPSAEILASAADTIQGGALRSYPFDPTVGSVEVLLTTDGRPLSARLEIIQGPNNNKVELELYTEDGLARPFFGLFELPGAGNVIRVVNSASMEYPLAARLVPYAIDEGGYDADYGLYEMDGPTCIGDAPRASRYG